jgi:hypothetical protein
MMAEKTKSDLDSGNISMRRSRLALCPLCDKAVELLSFDSAAGLFNTDRQDIEYLARNGSIHRVHNRKGQVMVCSISLFDCFENRRTRLLDSHFAEEMLRSDDSTSVQLRESGRN